MCVEGESFGNHVVFYKDSDPGSLQVKQVFQSGESQALFSGEKC